MDLWEIKVLYYDSCYKILAMMPEDKPEYIVPGHEGSLLVDGV